MTPFLQHTIVLTLVALCLVYALWQASRALSGKRSKLGSCCAKGCASQSPKPAGQGGQRIHFLPSDMLRKRR